MDVVMRQEMSLSAGDMLRMPEIGAEVPLAKFYEGT